MIGCNLVDVLKARRADVTASYHVSSPRQHRECYAQFDFTTFDDCLAATKERQCVFLCAARTFGVEMMTAFPTAFILPNLQIEAGLLEACRRNGVETAVVFSSTTVYQPSDVPVSERDLDLNVPPCSLYLGVGGFNRYLEQLAQLYAAVYPMRVVIVRPTSVFGPFDCFDDGKSHVIPALIKRALAREQPFIVWGGGDEVRDFIYVRDLVEDVLDLVATTDESGPLNIGSGRPIKIRGAVQEVLDVCGHAATPVFDVGRPRAPSYRAVDIGKIEALLGPRKRTSFRRALQETVEWYKNRG